MDPIIYNIVTVIKTNLIILIMSMPTYCKDIIRFDVKQSKYMCQALPFNF